MDLTALMVMGLRGNGHNADFYSFLDECVGNETVFKGMKPLIGISESLPSVYPRSNIHTLPHTPNSLTRVHHTTT